MRVNKAPALSHRAKEYLLGRDACHVCSRSMRKRPERFGKRACNQCPDNRFRTVADTEKDIALEASGRVTLLGC